MNRFLLPAVLAVVLHGLLFSMEADWLKRKADSRPRTQPIAISLTYKQPPRTPPPKRPEKVPEKPLPVIEKPKKKKVQVKPLKNIKPITPKRRPKPPEPKKTVRPKVEPEKISPPVPELLYEDEAPEIFEEEEIDLASTPMKEEDQVLALPDMKAKAPEPPPLQDAIPVYQENPPPKYPRIARRRGYQGTVILEVFINREGKVSDLRILESSGHSVLDRAAVASVKLWSFKPGARGEEKVEMWVKVPIRFQLK